LYDVLRNTLATVDENKRLIVAIFDDNDVVDKFFSAPQNDIDPQVPHPLFTLTFSSLLIKLRLFFGISVKKTKRKRKK
jgi:hypothetical protein